MPLCASRITPENPGFAVEGAIKDTGLISQLGKQHGVNMAVADLVNQHMRDVKQQGYGEMGELVLLLRRQAGVVPGAP